MLFVVVVRIRSLSGAGRSMLFLSFPPQASRPPTCATHSVSSVCIVNKRSEIDIAIERHAIMRCLCMFMTKTNIEMRRAPRKINFSIRPQWTHDRHSHTAAAAGSDVYGPSVCVCVCGCGVEPHFVDSLDFDFDRVELLRCLLLSCKALICHISDAHLFVSHSSNEYSSSTIRLM